MTRPLRHRLALFVAPLLLLAGLAVAARAQDKSPQELQQALVTLEALRESIADKQGELAAKQQQLDGASTEGRQELLAEAREIEGSLARLRTDFQTVATGLDFAEFQQARKKELDLKAEIQELLAPLIDQLKEATAAPRQIEDLRSSLAYYKERKQLSQEAISQIEELLRAEPAEALATVLRESLSSWQGRLRDIERQETVAKYQLDTRLESKDSLIDSIRGVVSEFFRSRGVHLLLAVVAFFTVFFGFRWLYRLVRRMSPLHKGPERPFYARLVDVLAHLFTGLAAVTASLLVLYATSDWVLLGLMLLFLLGVAWASKNTIPAFLDQIRLLLNFGTVRERERVVYNGLPWRVSKLSLYTILSNPALAGGIVRLPIRDLLEMRSRPISKDDVWFPSQRGDWVRLGDGRLGQVLLQTPESVKLRMLGGSLVTCPTLDYVGQSPENLTDGFRVAVTFGIDYAHQPISTAEVPRKMRARLERELAALVEKDELVQLAVEFSEAGASSLDYRVNADFAGSAAPRAEKLKRAVSRILVDACNEQGWVIPFTQITLHQAPAPT